MHLCSHCCVSAKLHFPKRTEPLSRQKSCPLQCRRCWCAARPKTFIVLPYLHRGLHQDCTKHRSHATQTLYSLRILALATRIEEGVAVEMEILDSVMSVV